MRCRVRHSLGWLLILVLGTGLPARLSAQRAPTIAAASNLNFALAEVATAFERTEGARVELVFGASGTLTRQIQDGAPFEMFLAADEEFPNQLSAAGLTRDAGVVYAVGRLALFAPVGSPLTVDERLDGLSRLVKSGRMGRFAIANPDVAPYGRAAEAVLRKHGLWEALGPNLVRGDTIAQPAQFATTGNAGRSHRILHRARSRLRRPWHTPSFRHGPSAAATAHGPAKAAPGSPRAFTRIFRAGRARHSQETRLLGARITTMDWTALGVSLWLGAGTLAILLPSAYGSGVLLALRHFRGKLLVEALVTVPLVLPPTVLGFYLLVAFGARSPLGQVFQAIVGRSLHSRSRDSCSHRRSPIFPSSSNPSSVDSKHPLDVRDAAACCGSRRGSAFYASSSRSPGRGPDGGYPDLCAYPGRVRRRADGGRQSAGPDAHAERAIYDRMQAFDDRSAGLPGRRPYVIAVVTLMATTGLSRRADPRRA